VRYIARKVPIEYWEIGNELYIHDDSPAAKQSGLTPEAYADRASSFIDAIRAVDPQARISAITDENYAPWGNHDWTKVVLNKVGDRIDSLSVHCGYAPVMFGDMGDSVRDVYRALLAAPVLVRGTLQRTDRQIAALPRKDADRIKIAVTEWGPLFQVLPTDRFVDHCKTLGSALYMASAFKAFLDVPRVEAASQFKLSDPLFIGMIGYRDGQPTPNPSYMLMKRLRRLARQKLVRCEVASPTYDSPSIGWVHAVKGVPLFECYVCRQGSRLTLVAINKSLDRPARVSLHGFAGKCRLWTLDGDSIDAHGDASPLSSPGLKWAEQAKDGDGPKRLHVVDRLATIGSVVSFPAHSVSVVEMQ
jgi:alpha-N-arabinofuranosidase